LPRVEESPHFRKVMQQYVRRRRKKRRRRRRRRSQFTTYMDTKT
jgi:hypothetical protein